METRPRVKIRDATIADLSTIAEFQRLMAVETEQRVLDIPTVTSGVLHSLENKALGLNTMAYIEADGAE